MAEKIQGRPWQPHEDALLLNAIHSTQGDIDWKIIAKSVPDRTNKACRKRWLHSLCPTVKKTAWTQAEDDTLLSLYNLHGPKWALIARAIPGRTDDACSKRYREALDPSLKRDEWTAEEDARLIDLQISMRGKWGQIGPAMGRSGLGCRNRWRLLERKRVAGHRTNGSQAGSSGYPHSTVEPLAGPSTLPPLQPPADQHMMHWGEDLLTWNSQFQPLPSPAYPYGQSQSDGPMSFYAPEARQHMQSTEGSPNDYDMYSLPGSFPPDTFLEHMEFDQAQPAHQQSTQPNLHLRDFTTSTQFDYMSTGPVSGLHSADHTYLAVHNHDPQVSGGTFATRILDSQIDPALTRGFDASIQARPLPHYPPRVVSAPQRIATVERPPDNPPSPVPLSARQSPIVSPAAAPAAFEPSSPTRVNSQPHSPSQLQTIVTSPGFRAPSLPPTVSSPQLAPSPLHDASNRSLQASFNDQRPPATLDIPSRNSSPAPHRAPFHGRPSPQPPSALDAAGPSPLVVHPDEQHSVTPPLAGAVPSTQSGSISSSEERDASQNTSHVRTRKKPFLSAFLPASSDPAVLAYACGMSDCWPNVNYATSSELAEHMRIIHPTLVDILSDSDLKPYRCSLTGCNKSWKSLNGLQYHLQVSKDHFRQALASAPPNSSMNGEVSKKGRKTHPCTYPGCPNVYKQLAGLRYHLKHGHPTDSPAQLEAVPPTLAKKVSERQTRKGGPQIVTAAGSGSGG
ncbi:hypothetical protein PENSPDRAFT_221890 [Peniophora sp. CONT]|nr:hypothetical protein PENSPDRAFT_221890 [Peniophora sp. CONT]